MVFKLKVDEFHNLGHGHHTTGFLYFEFFHQILNNNALIRNKVAEVFGKLALTFLDLSYSIRILFSINRLEEVV